MNETTATVCINALGCRKEGFPQTYLGLPLSTTKLKLSAYTPQIAKCDKYLAGWQTSLLNHIGQTTLVNSVLDCQLVYAMAALAIRPGVIDQIDKRRRSFPWAGSSENNGAKSLVVWQQVCDLKDRGGLGLKDLGIQNTCLLLKLIHKLHSNNASSWANWVQENACVASLTGNLFGHRWDVLRSLLPLYRAITTVTLKNGASTSFWHDVWDGDDSLADRFPVLLSHCNRPELTVKQAYEGSLTQFMVMCRSEMATTQLQEVTMIMEQHSLSQGKDQRHSMWLKKNGEMNSSMLYRTLKTANSSPDECVWNNKAPPRVKFFAWLLSKGRIQCKTNLQYNL